VQSLGAVEIKPDDTVKAGYKKALALISDKARVKVEAAAI
jgi:hypothetical protein